MHVVRERATSLVSSLALAWAALWLLAIYAGTAGSVDAGGGVRCVGLELLAFVAAVAGVGGAGYAAFKSWQQTETMRKGSLLTLAIASAVVPFLVGVACAYLLPDSCP